MNIIVTSYDTRAAQRKLRALAELLQDITTEQTETVLTLTNGDTITAAFGEQLTGQTAHIAFTDYITEDTTRDLKPVLEPTNGYITTTPSLQTWADTIRTTIQG